MSCDCFLTVEQILRRSQISSLKINYRSIKICWYECWMSLLFLRIDHFHLTQNIFDNINVIQIIHFILDLVVLVELMLQHRKIPMKRIKLEKWIKMEVMIRVALTQLDQKNQRNTLLPRSLIPQIKIIQPLQYVYCQFQIENAQGKYDS